MTEKVKKTVEGAISIEDEALLYSIIYNLLQVADLEKLGVGLKDWVKDFEQEIKEGAEHDYRTQLKNHANEVLDHSLAQYKGQIH